MKKKNMIMFIGKDGSRWHFQQLTGIPHPKTNDMPTLRKFAAAALKVDKSIERYEIIAV